jgi:hypothetical protein
MAWLIVDRWRDDHLISWLIVNRWRRRLDIHRLLHIDRLWLFDIDGSVTA